MCYETGFRRRGLPAGGRLPESVRERFWAAVRSGLTPTAAATVAGVSGSTGRQWAQDAGYRSSPQQRGRKYPKAVRQAFWAAVRSGLTPTQAAVRAGVSEHTGRYWVDQAGYVPRTPAPLADPELATCPRGPMSFIERCRLEELLESGYPQARASVLLGRDRSTIGRETRRGATRTGIGPRWDRTRPMRLCGAPSPAGSTPTLPCSLRFCDAWSSGTARSRSQAG